MSAGNLTGSGKERKYASFSEDNTDTICDIPTFLQLIGLFYTTSVVLYLQLYKGEYGQEIPIYIHITYIKPFAYFYTIVFSLMAMIPFAILRSIGTPRHTYPTSKTVFGNGIIATLGLNFIYAYNNANSIYAIMGPIYYFYNYYSKANSIENHETALVVFYPIAYILSLRFTLAFITEFVGCFLNMINMWKFTILQLNRDPIEIV